MSEPSTVAWIGERRQRRRPQSAGGTSRLSSPRGQLLLVAVVWLLTRLALLQDLGWLGRATSYEDVSLYRAWATQMVHTHQLPTGTSWQYPVGAALLFLVAELGPAHYDRTFCLLMLACDLGITATLATLSYRECRFHGVWAWLIATTVFGPIIFLRFDLAPTLAVVLALALLWNGRRLERFGAVLGIGVLLKVWPLLALLAVRTRRELTRAALSFVATVVIVTLAASIFLGNTLGFISNQAGRGLEVDAVAASPWFLVDVFTGKPLPFRYSSGATDLTGATAGNVASVLHILMIVAALLIAGWWAWRSDATRRSGAARGAGAIRDGGAGDSDGRVTSGTSSAAATARDAVLTALLWYLVVSPVLSPQYFIWVMGLGSLLLCSREIQMQRPLILLAVTLILTRALMQSGSEIYATTHVSGTLMPTTITCLALVARNIVLLFAAVEATRVVISAHRSSP